MPPRNRNLHRHAPGRIGRHGRPGRFALVLIALFLFPLIVHAAPVTPFYTQNQSPVALIFGLPAPDNAAVLGKGEWSGLLAVDVANNWARDTTDNENILLDGESYRVNLALRYGITKKIEGGIDIPYIGIGGGVFDHFIEGWHRFFGLPDEGRPDAPHNRLLYAYTNNGQTRLLLNDSGSGIGDIRLSGGVQLYNDERPNPRQIALRASIKLPTGDSDQLRGSGSTDFALWLTASDDYRLPALGHLTLFGAAGAMAMTDGDVLRDQQRNLAGFGTLGLGWAPAEVIDFKVQFSGHTPFFNGSELRELADPALQLIVGGSLHFSEKTSLDIGVSEDVAVNTSPDVALHLALRRRF
ncbi:MAG TPA: DUF3187 family protein [Geobacteraceae bacterium]|nr:DUF3187 family protein [Geobacteraceae bacterium]